MASDLLGIGSSGVLAQQRLLQPRQTPESITEEVKLQTENFWQYNMKTEMAVGKTKFRSSTQKQFWRPQMQMLQKSAA